MVKQYRIIVLACYLTEEILVIAKAGNAVFILSGGYTMCLQCVNGNKLPHWPHLHITEAP